jgi:hypothetical protein
MNGLIERARCRIASSAAQADIKASCAETGICSSFSICTPFFGKDFPFQKTYHFPRRKVPVDAANIVIPDGVIGTAELTIASGDNTIAGIVVITAGNGGFDVALEDFRSDVSGVVTANDRDRVGEVVQAGSLVLGSDIPIGTSKTVRPWGIPSTSST